MGVSGQLHASATLLFLGKDPSVAAEQRLFWREHLWPQKRSKPQMLSSPAHYLVTMPSELSRRDILCN